MPQALVPSTGHAAVEAGSSTRPDLLTDEAVGDAEHRDWEEEEGDTEVDCVAGVGEPVREHSRASLN